MMDERVLLFILFLLFLWLVCLTASYLVHSHPQKVLEEFDLEMEDD